MDRDKHWMIFDRARSKLVQQMIRDESDTPDGSSFGIKLWSKGDLDMNRDLRSWGSAKDQTAFYYLAQSRCPLSFQMLTF